MNSTTARRRAEQLSWAHQKCSLWTCRTRPGAAARAHRTLPWSRRSCARDSGPPWWSGPTRTRCGTWARAGWVWARVCSWRRSTGCCLPRLMMAVPGDSKARSSRAASRPEARTSCCCCCCSGAETIGRAGDAAWMSSAVACCSMVVAADCHRLAVFPWHVVAPANVDNFMYWLNFFLKCHD